MIYSTCQCIARREIDADAVAAAFARKVPVARSPSTDWSVDISLDDDLQAPHGAFLTGRHIALISPGLGKLMIFDGQHVTSAHQFGVINAPVAGVLPTERPGEFAVFFGNGKVDCFRAAD